MKWRKKFNAMRGIIRAICAVCVILIMLGLLLWNTEARECVDSNLTCVSRFVRPVILIIMFDTSKALFIDLSASRPLDFREIAYSSNVGADVRGGVPERCRGALAVSADTDEFLLAIRDELGIYSHAGELKKRHSVQDIAWGWEPLRFGSTAAFDRSRLFVAGVGDASGMLEVLGGGMRPLPFQNPILSPEYFTCHVDMKYRRAFLAGPMDGVYNLETGQFDSMTWGDNRSWDSLSVNEVLASPACANRSDEMGALYDFAEKSQRPLPWGAQVQWAQDGHVYLIRGGNQLWRYSVSRGDTELVYARGRAVEPCRFWSGRELVVSPGRDCIAFLFKKKYPLAERYDWGIVVIDLHNREYVRLTSKEIATGFRKVVRTSPPGGAPGWLEYMDTKPWQGPAYCEGDSIDPEYFWYPDNMALFVPRRGVGDHLNLK